MKKHRLFARDLNLRLQYGRCGQIHKAIAHQLFPPLFCHFDAIETHVFSIYDK